MSALVVNDELTAWFTPRGLAAYLAVSLRTVRRLIAEKKVRSVLVEGRRRIDPASVALYLLEQEAKEC